MNSILMRFVRAFTSLFSKPVFEKIKVLIVGAILSPASRTVTNALRVMGLSGERSFLKYHRVLARDRWSSLWAGKILLNSLLKGFGSTDEIVIGFDEHLERRRGRCGRGERDSIGMRCARRIHFLLKRAACDGSKSDLKTGDSAAF